MSKVSIPYIIAFPGTDGFDGATIKDVSQKTIINNFEGAAEAVKADLEEFFESALPGMFSVTFYKSALKGQTGAKLDSDKPRTFVTVKTSEGMGAGISGHGMEGGMMALFRELQQVKIDAINEAHKREIETIQGADRGTEVLAMLGQLLTAARGSGVKVAGAAPGSESDSVETDSKLIQAINNLKKNDPKGFAQYRSMIIKANG